MSPYYDIINIMKPFVLYLLAGIVSCAVCAGVLPILRRVASRAFLDNPGGLKTHHGAVPLLGGCGIFLGLISGLVFIRLTTDFPSGTLHTLRGICLGGLLVFLLGLADDLNKPKGVNITLKLLVQLTAVAALIYYGIVIRAFPSPWVAWPLTFLWVAGLTNAFNLLDIIDGLCVSQGVICTLGLTFIALPGEYVYVNFAALSLLGACLAFWPNNHARKKIFLGDSGSTLIGFTVASLSIGTGYSGHTDWGFLAPLFILAVPLFDTAFVSLARLLKGKNPLKGSPDHIALRLKKAGWKPGTIVTAFAATGLLCNGCAWVLTRAGLSLVIGLFVLTGLSALILTFYLLKLPAD